MALQKFGPTGYGELAGWLKDSVDRRFGPDWQCVVGKKEEFGSCLSPTSGHYVNMCVDNVCILLFQSS